MIIIYYIILTSILLRCLSKYLIKMCEISKYIEISVENNVDVKFQS